MWFIGVEVEQETSAPPPKKNPGSPPDCGEAAVSGGLTVITFEITFAYSVHFRINV